jgi:hypothetical protein
MTAQRIAGAKTRPFLSASVGPMHAADRRHRQIFLLLRKAQEMVFYLATTYLKVFNLNFSAGIRYQ